MSEENLLLGEYTEIERGIKKGLSVLSIDGFLALVISLLTKRADNLVKADPKTRRALIAIIKGLTPVWFMAKRLKI